MLIRNLTRHHLKKLLEEMDNRQADTVHVDVDVVKFYKADKPDREFTKMATAFLEEPKGIVWKKGNIFDSECEAIVIPVNCVGVAGAGLAKQAVERFGTFKHVYKWWCEKKILKIGVVCWHGTVDPPFKTIIVFPTKEHWKDPSKLEWIEAGLKHLVDEFKEGRVYLLNSIAFPMLGCGLGGLDKNDVKELYNKYLTQLPFTVEVWEQ